MAHTVEELLNMTDVQLDELFANGTVDEIPSGEAKGTAIIANSTRFSDEIAQFVNFFAWQGKTFDPEEGVLRNRITHFGFNAIIAKVYKAPAGTIKRIASFLTIPRLRWSHVGFAMKFVSSIRTSISDVFTGARSR